MSMSKKDYVAMAKELHDVMPETQPQRLQWELCCRAVANVFQRDNVRFNWVRFIDYCNNGE